MSTNEQATVRKWTVWVTDKPGAKPRSMTAEFTEEVRSLGPLGRADRLDEVGKEIPAESEAEPA